MGMKKDIETCMQPLLAQVINKFIATTDDNFLFSDIVLPVRPTIAHLDRQMTAYSFTREASLSSISTL